MLGSAGSTGPLGERDAAAGNFTMKEYLARRARRPLEALKPEHEVSDVLEHATVFLADLPAAREAATDQKCNALARLPCEEVRIESDWVAAVKPQPILVPYVDLYYQSQCISSGSDGDWSSRCVMCLLARS